MINLVYREHQPSAALRPYVAGYWSLTTDGKGETPTPTQRCFPAGTIEWITQIRGKNMVGIREDHSFTYPDSLFTGVSDKAAEWFGYGNSEMFGVRFTPEAAIHLFDISLKDFRNSFLDVQDLLGSRINPVVSNLISAETVKERLFLVETFLHHLVRQKEMERNYFTEALRLIRQSDDLNIHDLSKKVYVCKRQLQRSFQHHLGISPRSYYRLMRLYKAHQYGLTGKYNCTDLAYEFGYSDPAHFNRDFKDYFGLAPDRYFTSRQLQWEAA